MLRGAKQLLDLCTERFPSPRPSQHHSLNVVDGVLVLTVMRGDKWTGFNLSEVDLERDIAGLVDELEVHLKAIVVEEEAAEATASRVPDEPA